MLSSVYKGIYQLTDPPTRRILWICVATAVMVFGALWLVVWGLLDRTTLFQTGWLETAIDLLGGLATLVLTWFLFPGVFSAVMGLFGDGIAAAVETRHYPGLGPTRRQTVIGVGLAALRHAAIMVLLNVALLMFLVVPPLFPFVFYGANGYLLGREYFDLVALRRMEIESARRIRRANRGRVFVVGVLIAFLLTVPLVNLMIPVIATATMVHLFERWRSLTSNELSA